MLAFLPKYSRVPYPAENQVIFSLCYSPYQVPYPPSWSLTEHFANYEPKHPLPRHQDLPSTPLHNCARSLAHRRLNIHPPPQSRPFLRLRRIRGIEIPRHLRHEWHRDCKNLRGVSRRRRRAKHPVDRHAMGLLGDGGIDRSSGFHAGW